MQSQLRQVRAPKLANFAVEPRPLFRPRHLVGRCLSRLNVNAAGVVLMVWIAAERAGCTADVIAMHAHWCGQRSLG